MTSYEPLRLDKALALTKDIFCVVFSGKDNDDLLSHILIYEGKLEQPWSRFDVPRKIDGLTGKISPAGRPVFQALSDEGDIYTLPLEGEASHQKIQGAGVYSDDATDLGYVNAISSVGEVLVVSGYKSQLYRISGDAIEWFNKEALPVTPDTYDYLIFGKVVGSTEDDLYMDVSYAPTSTNRKLSEEEEDEMDRLYLAGRREEAYAIRQAAEGPSRVLEGRLYHWNGKKWSVTAKPRAGKHYAEPATLSDLFMEAEDKVWAVGNNGVILLGNARYGFQDVSFKGNDENLRSITRYRDRMVIASDYGLHWFDGHILSPLKPVLDPQINRSIPNPIKVQAVDDILYYFDSKHGVHIFDGEKWSEITIQAELLARDFKGLNTPRQ